MALAPSRVLIAVHGFESVTWPDETARTVSMWSSAALRILAVPSVPRTAFTSLTPMAARAYGAARGAWRAQEEARVRRVVQALGPRLQAGAEVVWVPAMCRDLVRTIAARAAEWPADALVVGAPERSVRHWIWPGPIHQGLLRYASCPVVVIPPRVATPRASIRLASGTSGRLAWLRGPQAQRGV